MRRSMVIAWFGKRSFFLALCLALAVSGVALAAPMPPRTVINHETRQCAMLVPGDECGDVILPPGWDYLPPGESCPAGYTTVDLRPDWAHFKVAHCCTEGHSGVSGDCEDLVIQPDKKICAFVDDIQSCSPPNAHLPEGWISPLQSAGSAAPPLCPTDFTWVDDVICLSDAAGQPGAATVFPQVSLSPPLATSTAGQTPPSTSISPTQAETTPSMRKSVFPCLPGGMLIFLLWVVWSKRR
jgi:hypothetical protein